MLRTGTAVYIGPHIPSSRVGMDSHIPEAASGTVSPSADSSSSEKLAVPVPRPIRLLDIPNIVHSKELSSAKDPLRHWSRDTPDFHGNPLHDLSWRAESYTTWAQFAAKGWGFTVDHGDAAVGYLPAKKTWSILDRMINSAIGGIFGVVYRFTLTSQQKTRGRELTRKLNRALEEALRGREDDMVCLRILYTTPARQGRGYASALVREVTKIADEQRRSTQLLSSNIANTEFYNSVGFVEKGRFTVGEDDPTWKEDPVTVSLMVRELPDHV